VPSRCGHSTRTTHANGAVPARAPSRLLGLSVVVVVLSGLVTGCTAEPREGGGGAGRAGQVGQGAAPGGKPTPSASPAAGEMVLPIDAYGVRIAERTQLGRARTVLIGQCVRRFGFSFDAAAGAAGSEQAAQNDVKDLGVYGNKRRYGVTSAAVAAKYGYHLESVVDRTAPGDERKEDPHGFGRMTPALQAVLRGKTASGARPPAVDGQQVPPKGCMGEAETKLAEAGAPPSFNMAELVGKIRADSFAASLTDPKVTATFAKWSACMRGKGYDFPMPLEASRDFDLEGRGVTPREIATAKADVACKEQTDLIEIWYGFESRYQQKQIDRQVEELEQIKKEHAARMRVVAEILAKA